MRKSLLGKFVIIKDNGESVYPDHYGWVVWESQDDNEYHVAGGSISCFGGIAPSFCREDFTVPRKQPDNSEVMAYLANLIKDNSNE